MGIDLTKPPPGQLPKGDIAERQAQLRERLGRLQMRMSAHKRRLIVLVEGWEGAGKRAFFRQLGGSFDPCAVQTFCTHPTGIDEEDRHWLARFWSELPACGETSLFFRSWYRALVGRDLQEGMDAATRARACDEINEFEAQQCDHETIVVKYFFHCSVEEQARRLEARWADPWQAPLTAPRTNGWQARRSHLVEAWQHIFDETDTRWAPWTMIDAEDQDAGILLAMRMLAETLDKLLPDEAPQGRPQSLILDCPA